MRYTHQEKKAVFIALRHIFEGQNALIRKLSTVRQRIQKHRSSILDLTSDFSFEEVVLIAKTLLDEQLFESPLKAKRIFPDLFQKRRSKKVATGRTMDQTARIQMGQLSAPFRSEVSSSKDKQHIDSFEAQANTLRTNDLIAKLQDIAIKRAELDEQERQVIWILAELNGANRKALESDLGRETKDGLSDGEPGNEMDQQGVEFTAQGVVVENVDMFRRGYAADSAGFAEMEHPKSRMETRQSPNQDDFCHGTVKDEPNLEDHFNAISLLD